MKIRDKVVVVTGGDFSYSAGDYAIGLPPRGQKALCIRL